MIECMLRLLTCGELSIWMTTLLSFILGLFQVGVPAG